jgi:hypothetical protein
MMLDKDQSFPCVQLFLTTQLVKLFSEAKD